LAGPGKMTKPAAPKIISNTANKDLGAMRRSGSAAGVKAPVAARKPSANVQKAAPGAKTRLTKDEVTGTGERVPSAAGVKPRVSSRGPTMMQKSAPNSKN
jgi:hypothetical protein